MANPKSADQGHERSETSFQVNRQALYDSAQKLDTASQKFALLPNNFNPDLPPKRRQTRPAKEETDAASKKGEIESLLVLL